MAYLGNTPDAVTQKADALINTPAGNIESTTVQQAVNELDIEKVSTSSISALMANVLDDTTTSEALGTLGAAGVALSNVFTKPQKAGTLALTHNTAWDGTDKQHLIVNVNGSSFTVANPSAQTDGIYYVIFVSYTTSHSLAFGNLFKGITDVSPTATVGAKDHFVFRSDGTNLHLVGVAYNVGA